MRLLVSFLTFFIVLTYAAQAQFALPNGMSGAELKSYLKTLPRACDLTDLQWNNSALSARNGNGLNKMTLRFYGNAGNTAHIGNLRSIQSLQEKFTTIRVEFIHVNPYLVNSPDQAEVIAQKLTILGLNLPWAIDTSRAVACGFDRSQGTFEMIDPAGNQIGIAIGALNSDSISANLKLIQNRLSEIDKMDRSPYLGNIGAAKPYQRLLKFPTNIEVDETFGMIFISDYLSNRILVISADGELQEVIGSGNPGNAMGTAAQAELRGPRGMGFIQATNDLYFSDFENHKIRRVDLDSMIVSDVLGTGKLATTSYEKLIGGNDALSFPTDMVSKNGLIYFVCLEGLYVLDPKTEVAERLLSPEQIAGRSISDLAILADGEITATLNFGNQPYIVGAAGLQAPLKIPNGAFGNVDGKSTKARFGNLAALTTDGDHVYLSDLANASIRIWTTATNRIETECSFPTETGFGIPIELNDLQILKGMLIAVDSWNGKLYKRNLTDGSWQAIALTNYQALAYSMQMGFNPIIDTDTLFVEGAKLSSQIEINLPAGWRIDPSGVNTVEISGFESPVSVNDQDMDGGKIQLRFASIPEKGSSLTLDVNYFLQSESDISEQYRVTCSYIIPLAITTTTAEIFTLPAQNPRD